MNNYINWIFANGRKLPTNQAGAVINAHDSQYHVSFEEATATGRPAMVLGADTDRQFFIDIDNCLVDGKWSALAIDLCQRFAGCFIEVSQSGNGLHIIGRASVAPDITCKVKGDLVPLPCSCGQVPCSCRAFDLYRSKRFVALTMFSASGSIEFECQAAMDRLVSEYQIGVGAAACNDIILRTQPVPEYTGKWPIEQIPDVIMKSELRNASKQFGNQASFKDLWEGDEGVLAQYYPSSSDSPFDRSRADLALCTALCFWTGNNHQAVDELYRSSGLMRDKWEKRADYRKHTMKLATGDKVYTYAAPVVGGGVVGGGVVDGVDGVVGDIGTPFLTIDMMMERFEGYVYVAKINRVFDPTNGLFLDQGRFNAVYGGNIYCMDVANQVTNSAAWNIVTRCQVPVIKKANTLGFKPLQPSGIINGEFNTYVPYDTVSKEGDPSPFIKHLKILLPHPTDFNIMINYMAAVVQYKGVKFQFAPVLQGVEGNGKSFINFVLSKCIGPEYSSLISGDTFSSTFNDWIYNKLFIGVEEFATSDKFNVLERIKPMITNERIDMNQKGVASFQYDNFANFVFNTNHKDGVRKTVNDRRYCVMYTAQQERSDLMPSAYYVDLWNWARGGGFDIIHWYLKNFKIDPMLNPATNLINAPRSSVHDEVIYNSLTNNETAVVEAVEDDRQGFRGGIISSQRVKDLTQYNGKRVSSLLSNLGYKKVCRCSRVLMEEGGVRPYLWVEKEDSRHEQEIIDSFLELNYKLSGHQDIIGTSSGHACI